MAPVKVDPDRVHAFPDVGAFEAWLARNHDREPEVWIKIHKVGSGLKSITPREAIDAVLCWGWIDGIRKGLDEQSFLQRYSPRGAKSVWSRINIDNVARLTAEGRMTEHGLKHVQAAKADGRWDRAYGGRTTITVPDDLAQALAAEPAAQEAFEGLDGANRYAVLWRVHTAVRPETRAKRITALVQMLAEGRRIH